LIERPPEEISEGKYFDPRVGYVTKAASKKSESPIIEFGLGN
jgi:hypothetical protein